LFFLCTHYVGLLILSGTLGIHTLTCLNETNLFAIKKLWHQVIEWRWEAYMRLLNLMLFFGCRLKNWKRKY
jgi:hypothetical protein